MLDDDKIDEAVLALLLLGLHDGARAWKGFDWDAMNRLYEKGFIFDPRGKAKSVVLTEEGLAQAKLLLEKLFSKRASSVDCGFKVAWGRESGAQGEAKNAVSRPW